MASRGLLRPRKLLQYPQPTWVLKRPLQAVLGLLGAPTVPSEGRSIIQSGSPRQASAALVVETVGPTKAAHCLVPPASTLDVEMEPQLEMDASAETVALLATQVYSMATEQKRGFVQRLGGSTIFSSIMVGSQDDAAAQVLCCGALKSLRLLATT